MLMRKNIVWSGFVHNIIEKKFPITMPYMPSDPIKVYCSEFKTNNNGIYDTLAIFYAVTPEDTAKVIDLFFKYEDNDWKEITQDEYKERKTKSIKSE